MKRVKEVKDGKGTKGTNPIPSLLAAPNGAQLQWLVEWFGLLSDEEEAWGHSKDVGMPCFKCCSNMLRSSAPPGCRQASKLGVQRFPLELVRNDPNLKESRLQMLL